MENLSIRKLISLTLIRCIHLEHLPSLAELVLLKNLALMILPKLQQIGRSSHMSSTSYMELLLPSSLETLVVKHCQGLRELPILPSSLVYLKIIDVGLTKLPVIGTFCNETIETKSSKCLDIQVCSCPSLTSLEGSLIDQKEYSKIFRDIHISNCGHLQSLSSTFEQMNGLRRLYIQSCPMLTILRDTEDKLLPSSLTDLTIWDCGDMERPLLGSLQQLTNLSSLQLIHCSRLVSLPSADVFKNLRSLKDIYIANCENLSSLGGLGSIPSLCLLSIASCSYLEEAVSSPRPEGSASEDDHLVLHKNSLTINELKIDLPSLLLVEPLKNLCHTRKLEIEDGTEMESLPEQWLLQNKSSLQYLSICKAESLESLQPCMQDLSSLEQLHLFGARKLRSLPYLPSSLQYLGIKECDSELEEKSRENGSPEWNKISIIPRVQIGISVNPLPSSSVFTCFLSSL